MSQNHHNLQAWQHGHDFLTDRSAAERSTGWVMALTAAMMVLEILVGTLTQSMALLADGWHMATHVAAFGLPSTPIATPGRTLATRASPSAPAR
jgi:Co/Zn/Cd efflux system component